jgi:hypothetical protein
LEYRESGKGNLGHDRNVHRSGFGQNGIDPALKTWLDNIFVPAVVRQYLTGGGETVDNGVNLNPIRGSVQ